MNTYYLLFSDIPDVSLAGYPNRKPNIRIENFKIQILYP